MTNNPCRLLSHVLDTRKWEDVVVVTRCRPTCASITAEVDATATRLVTIRDTHVSVYRPRAEGYEISVHSFLVPSIADLEARTVFAFVIVVPPIASEKDDLELEYLPYTVALARRACIASTYGLQNIFDLHVIQFAAEQICQDDMVIASALYIFCLRAAIHHLKEQRDTPFAVCVKAHERLVCDYKERIAAIDDFFSATKQRVQRVVASTFKDDRLRDFVHMTTTVGLGVLIGLCDGLDAFRGIDVLDVEARRTNVVDAIGMLFTSLAVDKTREDLSAALQCTMLHGKEGLVRVLRMHRIYRFQSSEGSAPCKACAQITTRSCIYGEYISVDGVGRCIDCFRTHAARCDMQHIAVSSAIFSSRVVARNVELSRELEAVQKKEAETQKKMATSQLQIDDLRRELVQLRKELKNQKKRSSSANAVDETKQRDAEAMMHSECIRKLERKHADELEKKDRELAERAMAFANDMERERERDRALCNALEEKHARTLARYERQLTSMDASVPRTCLDVCIQEMKCLEAELLDAQSFEDTQVDMTSAQQTALTAASSSSSESELHLNSIWREKYAYMAGQAKVTQRLYDQLCASIAKSTDNLTPAPL